jgi:hypothetical protein
MLAQLLDKPSPKDRGNKDGAHAASTLKRAGSTSSGGQTGGGEDGAGEGNDDKMGSDGSGNGLAEVLHAVVSLKADVRAQVLVLSLPLSLSLSGVCV